MKRLLTLVLIAALSVTAAGLFLNRVTQYLPFSLWSTALLTPSAYQTAGLIFLYNDLPRLLIACVCGAGLAFSGVIAQQMLRNPLAEPMTLGIASGAWLSLSLATVFFPVTLTLGRAPVAFVGGGLALCMVLLIALRRRSAGQALILAGMILNLCCSAVGVILAMLYFRQLNFMALWGGGSLAQYDWHGIALLSGRLLPCIGFCLLFIRPMTIYGAGENQAKHLGISLPWLLTATMASTLLITAFIVSSVGTIGFIGLGGPHLARLAGARRLRDRLLWAPLIGMVLLWLADEIARRLSGGWGIAIPTGAVTTLIGAPVILGYLSRARAAGTTSAAVTERMPPGTQRPFRMAIFNLMLLPLLSLLFLTLGKGLTGWQLEMPGYSDPRFLMRITQLSAAIAVGVLLAVAGGIIQRLSANPLASPDLLGITSGGALGITGAIFLTQATTAGVMLGCVAGCGAVLLLLLLLGRRSAYAPDVLLLAGVSLTLLLQAISTVAMASGDLRVMQLFSLLIGSTYSVTPGAAAIVMLAAVGLLAALPLLARWLLILPLGSQVAYGRGINVSLARLTLWLISAAATAVATMIIGPLSFIGLIAPHIAKSHGSGKPLPFLLTAASFGALLMLSADWIGRWVRFPYEIATGAIVSLIGGLYLALVMLRGR
ncbi:hypothetical protein BTJ39_00860 [Izhakiella australiensis]|uniref:Fe3+-hydroxamate ABC transporter permease FhuB n=1 Tax=Izhakiella australiensis TaxID=1926881 RepID=A0A1S8YRI5_9GAMM|nr:Fe(3+)-hydroxamate ABC transporter permease FhuB [Izhakiella australiensis]OON41749.1 hypothetical protein BTJ39_00860 [Izhakiella australiensis]